MRIFITGICGFLGSHLAESFIKEGHTVAGCDNLSGGDPENLPAHADFAELDCRDLGAMSWAMRHFNPEVVYHTAAHPHEGLSVFSPVTITESIYGSSVSVVTAAIKSGAKRFVNMSSMARYGYQPTLPFTEEMTPNPVDPYGIAKLAAEQTIRLLCQVHGLEFVNCVPHNIAGARQKYDDPFRNVVSIMANRMLKNQPPIIYGDGTQMRCFSHVQDDLPVLVAMANLDRKDIIGETFNVGPDEEFVTINELAQVVARHTGFKGGPIYFPDRPQEVKHANCSAQKIRRYFEYQTKKKLEDIVADVVAHIQKRGVREFRYYLPLEIESSKTPRTWKERLI